MRQYTVLRNLSLRTTPRIRTRSAGPYDAFATGTKPTELPEPKIETRALRADEVTEVTRETGVSAIAPVMRTTLVRPYASESTDTDEVWGIAAVKADNSPFS